MQDEKSVELDTEATKEKIVEWITARCDASIDEIIQKALGDQKVFLIMASFGMVLEDEIIAGLSRCCKTRTNNLTGENNG